MNNKNAGFILFSSVTLLLYGCGVTDQQPSRGQHGPHHGMANLETQDSAQDEHLSHGVAYKEGRGLSVPSWTSQTIGLKIVDVDEGRAVRKVELPLRIFEVKRSGGVGVALASGALDTLDAASLQNGTKVRVEISGGRLIEGEVVRVEEASAKLTGLAEVIVSLPSEKDLEVGSFLDGSVTFSSEEDAVVIPKQALLKTAEGHFAYVVNGESLFRTKIGVGGQEGDVVEVTDGLYAGDQVVLQPVMTLWLAELQAIRGGKACADGH